jgi:hypothetical protein
MLETDNAGPETFLILILLLLKRRLFLEVPIATTFDLHKSEITLLDRPQQPLSALKAHSCSDQLRPSVWQVHKTTSQIRQHWLAPVRLGCEGAAPGPSLHGTVHWSC